MSLLNFYDDICQDATTSTYRMPVVSPVMGWLLSCYELRWRDATTAWATRTLITRKLKGLEEFIGACNVADH